MKRLEFPDDTDLIVKYGLPFIRKGKNTVAINPRFWAAKFLRENYLVYYNTPRGGCWFLWTGSRYEEISQHTIWEKMEAMLLGGMKNADLMLQNELDIILPRIFRILNQKCDKGRIPPLGPGVIPFKNGIAQWNQEIHDFDFRQYTREDAVFSTLDVDYDPNCTSPLFLQTLAEILHDEDDRRVIQEYFGACLFSENRSRRFLVLQGEVGCGKSTLVKILISILTRERVFDLNFDSIRQNYEFSSLESQTLMTASEAVSSAFSQPAGVEFVKKAVGGDLIETSQKFRNAKVAHYGYYSLIIVSNNKFRFQYDGRGDEFKDRMILIQFVNHFDKDKRDLELETKLLACRSAILNWMLEGARRIRENGWKIELSPEQILRRDHIIEASKGVENFVSTCIQRAAGESFTSDEAYSTYIRFQRETGAEDLTEAAFQRRLAKAMRETYCAAPNHSQKGGNKRGYSGYRLAN